MKKVTGIILTAVSVGYFIVCSSHNRTGEYAQGREPSLSAINKEVHNPFSNVGTKPPSVMAIYMPEAKSRPRTIMKKWNGENK